MKEVEMLNVSPHGVKMYIVMLAAEFDREEVAAFFNTQPQIQTWFYALPYSVFIKTDLTAIHISGMMDSRFGTHRQFLVAEINRNYYGRLENTLWQYFPPI